MNQIRTDDEIKALAVTILEKQESKEFLACQDGFTLIKIKLKNQNFEKIPLRTLFFVQGKLRTDISSVESLTIEVDLNVENHRFISLNPETIKLYQGLSVFDILESIPVLSDKKSFPDRTEFDGLCLFKLKKHAHFVKIVRDELSCGDFGETIPKYIKGSAYQTIFHDYKNRMNKSKAEITLRLDETCGRIKTAVKRVRQKTQTNITSQSDKPLAEKRQSKQKSVSQISPTDGFNLNSDLNSMRIESDSDESDICVVRKKRRKTNPFIDDEADDDNNDSCSADENDADSDGNLDGFIDDSEEPVLNDFDLNKQVEIEINREKLLKFLADQTSRDLEQMGLSFVYSHPEDLV